MRPPPVVLLADWAKLAQRVVVLGRPFPLQRELDAVQLRLKSATPDERRRLKASIFALSYQSFAPGSILDVR